MLSPLLLALLGPAFAQDPPPAPGEAGAEQEAPPPLVKDPALINFVQAAFPQEAKDAGIEGIVLLLLEVNETGQVYNVTVLESAGWGFDEAAVEAAKQFVFSPAEDAAGPVPVALEFEYGFVLDAAATEGALPEEPVVEEVVELPVNLEGQVVEMATRRPLPEMSVAVPGTDLATLTDAEGRFALRGVPIGPAKVVIARPGWQTQEVDVVLVEGEATNVVAWVRNESYDQDAAMGVYRKDKVEVTQRTITMGEVRRIPGTFGDPIRVVQSLPGAARSPFGTGVLIIRGSNPEDSGVYVEGVRIPFIYHIGGYVSVFNPDLIGAVDYLPGNYGAQYGRTTGGVIDVKIKQEAPEQGRLVWSTDLLDSGGFYEGRLGESGNHHIGVAARRSYIDAVLPLVPRYGASGFVVRPRWADYQVRYGYTGLEDTRVTAFVFGFSDKLLVGSDDGVAQGTDQDTQDDFAVNYWSQRALVTVEHRFSDKLTAKITPAFGWDYTYLGSGQSLQITQDQWIWQVRGEAVWRPHPTIEVIPGIDWLWGGATFEFGLPFNPNSLVEYDPLAEREDYTLSGKGQARSPDVYLKANWRPFKDPERLLITPGLRVTPVRIVDELDTISFDPRVIARAKVVKGGFVKAATGIYSQPPQSFEAYHPNPDIRTELVNERAWTSTLGYEQQLTQGLSVELEVFTKDLDNLIVSNRELQSLSTDQFNTNEGVGRVKGLEFMLRQAAINQTFGWVSYTLSKSERRDYPDSEWVLFDFDQTHILTVVGGYKLPYGIEASGRFQYVTGNPYTPYAGGVYDIDQDFYSAFSSGDTNSERLPSFVALDLRIDKAWTFKQWRMNTYVDFLNAYRGVNPEFVQYNYDYTESAYIRGLPFIPSPGVNIEVFL
ncbi:MAG: TonB family protein [Deltaproteobacteria bacterium]|nr:TonB family protein [Deltaproteobacteria bacterium]